MRPEMRVIQFPQPYRCSALVGVSAVVGFIGGFYALTRGVKHIIDKLVDKKAKQQIDAEPYCNVCCHEVDLANTKSFVICHLCKKNICRDAKCIQWRAKTAQWECQLCQSSKESLAQTSSWVAEQMSFNQQKFVYPMRARSEIYIPITDCHEGSTHFESVSQIGINTGDGTITAAQKLKIREYVEEVVASMLGGSLDSIRVGQMSKSENYLPAVVNNAVPQNSLSSPPHPQSNTNNHNEFADMSQTRLRQLIENIIAETLRMPALSSSAVSEIALDARTQHSASSTLPLTNGGIKRRHRAEHYFEPKIYQDLLATAVLNKIVDKQDNVRNMSESTPDLSGHHIDANFNVEVQSTTSGSSVEPRSDCSSTDTEQIGKGEKIFPCDSQRNLHADDLAAFAAGRESALSDYIAVHMVPLPDLSAPVTESEEDDYISVTSSAIGEGTWEDNWLFRKKRSSLQTSVVGGSVGMLVPAPKEDVRAQIGDKTADEVSDLSEMGSDTESSLELSRTSIEPLNDRLLSKQLIGGQNTKIVLDELLDHASMVSSTSPTSNEPVYTETRNEHVVDSAAKTEAINKNIKNLQKDAETELELLTPPMEFKDENGISASPNSNPISDQLSNASHRTDESALTIIETFTIDDECVKTAYTSYSLDAPLPSVSIQAPNTNASTTTTTTTTTTNNIDTNATKLSNGPLTNAFESTVFSDNNARYEEHFADVLNGDDDDVVLMRHFLPGSIAEREYKKWNNAVEMPNNPYAPEALKRRISGSQERFIDIPNISPSNEKNPITLIKDATAETNADVENRENDYKRYSRDYYINDAVTVTSPKHQLIGGPKISDDPSASIIINEVNSTGNHFNNTSSRNHNDCHWTLSTPVRRSSSLKFISNRSSPQSHYNFTSSYDHSNHHNQLPYRKTPPPPRSLTSASHYADDREQHGDYNYNNVDDDVRSQRSWKSASATKAVAGNATLPKRRSLSSLSFYSSASGLSLSSAGTKRRTLPDASVLSQFEKQLLHKDLKRNSFRAISSTTKDFVMNPLFECEGKAKLTLKPDFDEQVDSGVDSCLNGFSGTDAKTSNNSLLF